MRCRYCCCCCCVSFILGTFPVLSCCCCVSFILGTSSIQLLSALRRTYVVIVFGFCDCYKTTEVGCRPVAAEAKDNQTAANGAAAAGGALPSSLVAAQHGCASPGAGGGGGGGCSRLRMRLDVYGDWHCSVCDGATASATASSTSSSGSTGSSTAGGSSDSSGGAWQGGPHSGNESVGRLDCPNISGAQKQANTSKSKQKQANCPCGNWLAEAAAVLFPRLFLSFFPEPLVDGFA